MWLHSFVENIGPHTSIYKMYMIIVYNKKKKKKKWNTNYFITFCYNCDQGWREGILDFQKSSLPLVFLVKIIILDINFINGPLDFYQKNM